MDKERFFRILQQSRTELHDRSSIGTLSEKTTHWVCKNYIEPNPEHQERKVGSFFADIVRDHHIYEIQSASFGALRPKLDAFLKEYEVTIVYPVPSIKYLLWIRSDGEVTPPRKSPLSLTAGSLLPPLVYILPYLNHPNLHFSVFLFETYEYRYLDGWSRDGKKGSSRFDRVPQSLLDIINLSSSQELWKVLPPELPERFTAADLKKLGHYSPRETSAALKVLKTAGLIDTDHKEGRTIVHKKCMSPG